MPKDVENPVLELHDKYFGNYWKGMTEEERKWTLNLLKGRSDEDMFCHERVKDIGQYIMRYREDLDDVEAQLEVLAGIPPFPISPYPSYVAIRNDDFFQLRQKEFDETPEMVSKHYSAWIRKTLDALDTRSHFSKLPFELKDIIVKLAVEDVDEDWEFPGKSGNMVYSIELRRCSWEELVDSDIKNLFWNLVMLAELLYERWIQLRKALVFKYEVNEETEKEWQLIQKAGIPLY